ncbi:PAZ domain,Helicase, C-terminal,Ribonuclease III domain,DEAD/DEAH box helicase domain,P-loop containing [Cinara cedri]|uniref:PAZ domain,Helicase, C-terminal,Ribonuclease III domain,DEAD/DEAH box helicase domain,P-loop containing n=1 Tax=Cinara cedri TaxID=506608 RepID=A0A5E4MRN6_9HEMI|nr:PAZ domain,Helicase, C-terminal,Ribonuclease III domain,DEAD/DEAH box helicase domain,P-loop containing [Cinara cedri]
MEEKLEKPFVPCEYQSELLEEVKKENTILFLPTGSGKTYIATMFIKEMGECLNKPIGKGRKWTFYIVQSVPLVNQQASSLRRHLPWNIGTFSGDMNVDFWTRDQWNNILEKCHVIVMTAQIYLNHLRHGYINICNANLIIIDECHHAVSNHPFKKIMQVIHDTDFQPNTHPRVLGLTATLINSNTKNVKDELTKLQQTFSAVIKTKYEKNIKIFSAPPEESIHLFDEYIVDKKLLPVIDKIRSTGNYVRKCHLPFNNEPIIQQNNFFYFNCQRQPSWNLENYFFDIEETSMLLNVMSELTLIQKAFNDVIKLDSLHNECSSILMRNASLKLKQLIQILSNIQRTDTCLIFVDRQTTAKVLYHFIKCLVQDNYLPNIECDFIVGTKIMYNLDSKEMIYKKYQNNDIIKRFNENTINVLITSEELEECVDIQTCNYVIRYDFPKNFPSYVQSKGRARYYGSKFIVMVPNIIKFKKIHSEFAKMEEDIIKLLTLNEIDNDNIEENVKEVFKTKFAILTHEIAISIINRYCFFLPQDRFTNLTPEWYVAENDSNCKKYKLKLPINGAIQTTIENFLSSLHLSNLWVTSFNACVELYQCGALDDHLLPIKVNNEPIFKDVNWFPHWDEKDIEAASYNLKPGTNKMKRMVNIKVSYYTLLLSIDIKYETFDKLLRSNKEFGILTSAKLPHVSNFPIFLDFGDVNIQIKVNVDEIFLDSEEQEKIEHFHNKLFVDVLGVKDFICRCYSNEDNAYLIVPIYSNGGKFNLDWSVMNIHEFVELEFPTIEQRESKFYEEYLKTPHVISPWYRNIEPIQRYVVTDVHYDMTPESAFPTNEFDTYESYFLDKYSINVMNKTQPMIKVKSLRVSKINYLTPKISTGKIDKRNEYIEILVPEFCIWHKFPSDYWLKALMLPTILFRLNSLLLAENLLVKINTMCNIIVEKNDQEDKVEMDSFCGFNEGKKKAIILPIGETLKSISNLHDTIGTTWNSKCMPFDIDRQINTTMLDVLNYHTFMNDMKEPKTRENTIEIDTILTNVLSELNILRFSDSLPPVLEPLLKKLSDIKTRPTQSDILKVLTTSLARDMFNYERMKTYGNSFLKFAISLALFDAFPAKNEGFLTDLKMKIVGNRNLTYVGKNIDIGSYLKVNVFNPVDWIPPCFSVSTKIKEIIEKDSLKSNVLQQISIPRDEKFSGKLSGNTWIDIVTVILKCEEIFGTPISYNDDGNSDLDNSQSDLFIHKKTVSDKMVAHCVESLIGTYVKSCGVEVGFKVLHGLGILPERCFDKPKEKQSNYKFLNCSTILPGYEILEGRIGYSFKNKSLLYQALTHPSYQLGITECYQRLKFLGDAILDFIITTYITEHCSNKTTEEITDIRSSLVNNITFASLSIRIGLHRFLLSNSIKLTEAIDRFYEYQQRIDHKISQEVLYLIEERDYCVAESIDVPKVLGDLFESLIAAIYLDCGRDLNFVWSICYKFLEHEIKEFSTNVPKNPICVLNQIKVWPIFSKPPALKKSMERGMETMMQLDLTVNNEIMTIYGFGNNKKEAKVAAAKMALKHLKKIM